jgi:hypothetical protein
MPDWTLRDLRDLLRRLERRGVQLAHNRGKVIAAPFSRLSEAEVAFLREHKAHVIELLRREGFHPHDADQLVAPTDPKEGSYAGRMLRRPWNYEVTVMIPTLNCVALTAAAVPCWRNQTVAAYMMLVDTGSYSAALADLGEFRSYDVEIHHIAAHGWRHSSQPVSAALDLAFALCQTNHLLLTHADVFPRHDRVLETLIELCTRDRPVVGYQMSPRLGSEEWRQNVSHTCTMLHMPTIRAKRLTWNLLTALEADDELETRYLGWPDTETQFGRSMQQAGIVPTFLGGESNASVYETELIVHWRSAVSVQHYRPDQRDLRHPGLDSWLSETMARGCAAPLPVFEESAALPEPSQN